MAAATIVAPAATRYLLAAFNCGVDDKPGEKTQQDCCRQSMTHPTSKHGQS
jgi:hypothetical protein